MTSSLQMYLSTRKPS